MPSVEIPPLCFKTVNMSRNSIFIVVLLFLISCGDDGVVNPPVIMLQSVITTQGSRNADVWGVESGGNEYAIIGDFSSSRNVSFIDVIDPINPQIVSVVDNVLGWDIKVFGNHVYVANSGLTSGPDSLSTIINISDISNPQVVSTFQAAHSTWVDDQGYLYISGGVPGNVRIYNLNPDPVNPTLVWEDMTGEASHDIAVIRGRLYDFHRYSGTFIYDVSNPENPVLIGFVDYIGEIPGSSGDDRFAFNHNGWVTEDDRYLFITDEKRFGDGPGIVIYDISNLSQISRVGEILVAGARSHNIYIVNNLAYVSHYGDGFHVYDVSNPPNPVLLDKYNTNLNNTDAENGFFGAFGVYPFATSGNIYVSDMNNDLFVFKVE